MKVYREDGARLFLDRKRNRHKLEEGKFQLRIIKRISPMKSGQTLEQVVQRGCATSILGDIKNPARHGPEEPDLTSKLALHSAGIWNRCPLQLKFFQSSTSYMENPPFSSLCCLLPFLILPKTFTNLSGSLVWILIIGLENIKGS